MVGGSRFVLCRFMEFGVQCLGFRGLGFTVLGFWALGLRFTGFGVPGWTSESRARLLYKQEAFELLGEPPARS